MKPFSPLGYARILCLLALVGVSFLGSAQAAPPPGAFGVWDRGSSFNNDAYDFSRFILSPYHCYLCKGGITNPHFCTI